MSKKEPTKKLIRQTERTKIKPAEHHAKLPLIMLDETERMTLRKFLDSNLGVKWLGAINQYKPDIWPADHFAGQGIDMQTRLLKANNRLHELRGWEKHNAVIFELLDPIKLPQKIEEPEIEYPNLKE